jgi:hypothetical protein
VSIRWAGANCRTGAPKTHNNTSASAPENRIHIPSSGIFPPDHIFPWGRASINHWLTTGRKFFRRPKIGRNKPGVSRSLVGIQDGVEGAIGQPSEK